MTCPRCDLGDHGTKRRPDGVRHVPTTRRPSQAALEHAVYDGACDATDGCSVETDGTCQHGHRSWLLVLGLI